MFSKIRKSLTIKMFLLISVSFVFIFSVVLFFQSQFFSKYYESTKTNNVINKINELSQKLESQNWEIEDLYREIKSFGLDNNVTVQLLNIELPEEYNDYSLVTVLDENEHTWEFYVSDKFSISVFRAIIEKKLDIKGYIKNDKMLIVTHINDNKISNFKSHKLEPYQGEVQLLNRGKIGEVIKSNYVRGLSVKFHNSEYSKNGVDYTTSKLLYSNTKTVLFSKQVDVLSQDATIFVTASLQPVDEAISMLSSYIPLFLGFAIGLSVLIALVYSKTVSRPIIKITQTANRMANMDFSVKEETSREDELGVLSSSINTLSGNLENVLGELKSANSKLKEDYENEIRQETVRRDFIANASHELKTPLGVIKSYVEAVRDNIKSQKRDYYFDVIMDETSKMDDLIMQMLALAKIDADNTKLDIKTIDMNKVIGEVVRRFSGRLSDKDLDIKVLGEFSMIDADSEKIHQVLYNFIDNAVKYSTPKSDITITGIKKEDKLRIEFANCSEPIDEASLENVWNRFYKIDTSHNRQTEGSGLGLAIVKSILDMHGFSYGVYTIDGGVVFWVEAGLSPEKSEE